MIVSFLVNNKNSWILKHVEKFIQDVSSQLTISLITENDHVPRGDLCFFLSCNKIVPKEILKKNKMNLVIHESSLPKGRGFSPISWQIEEGKNLIPVCLFEAITELDGGPIFDRDEIVLDGTELIDEIRIKQWDVTKKMILRFLKKYPNVVGTPQKGNPTFYPKRTDKDNELNIDLPLSNQFHKIRVCDNEKFPAHFYINKQRFILKIRKV